MKKFINLEQTPVEIPGKALAMAERAVNKPPRKRKSIDDESVEATTTTKKKRGPRQLRAFRYRGEQFMFINNDDLTLVCTVDKETHSPQPVVRVEPSKAMEAVRALAKVIQAEEVINSLKR